MTDAAEAILEEAMKLPESERRVLALCLLDSVGEGPLEDVEQAWIAEARRRLEDIRAGRARPVPWDEARQRIFSRS